MANPFGIEQVDVPGILGVYQGAQDRRVNQMLLQRKMAAEDRAVEQQHTISAIWKNYQDPTTKGGGQSPAAAGASPAPTPAASPLAAAYTTRAPMGAEPDDGGEIAAPAAPVAASGAAPSPLAHLPPVDPASVTPADKSFVDANEQGIRQLLGLNADEGLKFLKFAQGMDDDRRKRIVDAQDAIHSTAAALQNIPYAQRKAVLQQQAPDLLAAHPGLTPQMIQNFDPTDQNIQIETAKAIGIKGMMDYAEKTATMAETHRHNVADETNSANNGYLNAGFLPPGSAGAAPVDGGATPAAGATGTRYTGGWTPRARNGGDNSDAAVDSKIAGAAQFLGVAPGADISKLPPLKIAQAMALSEGGAGSKADRYNNPANLRNSNGTFRQFATKEEGIQAAAQLVQRKLSQGQTTVQSMIEGLPKGGGSPAPASGLQVIPGGKLDHSAGVDQATVEFYGQKVAAGGDLPAFGMGKEAAQLRQAILKRSAEIQMGQGVSGGDSNLLHADVKSAGMALTALQKTRNSLDPFLQTFDGASAQVRKLAPKGAAGSAPVFNRWIQAGRTGIAGDPDVTALNIAIAAVANENAKIMSGASGGAVTSDSARHEAMSLINNAQTLPQLYRALDQMHTDTQIRLKSLDDRQAQLRQVISGHGSAPPSSAPVHIANAADYAKLASGAHYIDPQGQPRIKR